MRKPGTAFARLRAGRTGRIALHRMATPKKKNPSGPAPGIEKAKSGIHGLDDITGGGLPRGRTTLISGGAGCGKSMFGLEFLVNGITAHGEPGVLVTFEESAREIAQNAASLGHDIDALVAGGKLFIDHVRLERSEIAETGDYDLEGLFVRLQHAIDEVGAKRIVLDTLEALFAGLSNEAILRAELRRLFRWLKERGLTALVTAEAGDRTLTRQGLEEYVSDCVIALDHRVVDQVSTRRLRVVKYRGSAHGTNEYPFLIDARGIKVLPITSLGLEHDALDERIPSGIPALDEMLGGDGFYRGSTVLVTGSAGTGKTSVAAHFAAETARRGERVLYLSFEESQSQIVRNQLSIGLDLLPAVERDLVRFRSVRGAHYGLEMHLASIYSLVEEFEPAVVILDPITALRAAGTEADSTAMLVRVIDFLKVRGITTFLTDLQHSSVSGVGSETTSTNISSIVDTWILLRDIELGGERNRALYVLKSRGMFHSNQIREYRLSDQGFEFRDVYIGQQGVLTGTLRTAQEARDAAEQRLRHLAIEGKQRDLERKRKALDARIETMRMEFEAEQDDLKRMLEDARRIEEEAAADTRRVTESRMRGLGRDGGKRGKRVKA